jgi:hypothetical protein
LLLLPCHVCLIFVGVGLFDACCFQTLLFLCYHTIWCLLLPNYFVFYNNILVFAFIGLLCLPLLACYLLMVGLSLLQPCCCCCLMLSDCHFLFNQTIVYFYQSVFTVNILLTSLPYYLLLFAGIILLFTVAKRLFAIVKLVFVIVTPLFALKSYLCFLSTDILLMLPYSRLICIYHQIFFFCYQIYVVVVS